MMIRLLLSGLIFSLAHWASAASAAGSNFTAVYSLARNGIEMGQVTDAFRRTGERYSLVSESRAIGPLKLIVSGTNRLESQGFISNNNLAPTLYRRLRSDNPKKTDQVQFDWKAMQLTLRHNDLVRQEALSAGTQDNLSQLYSFLYLPGLPDKLVVPVANGKDVDTYRYSQYPSPPMTTPAGTFEVVEYRRDATLGQKAISVWISRDLPHLPIQIRVVEDGVRVEQKLAALTKGGS
ncbi:MAG TPA: DUF3108 domain-containing protein [Thiobacillaceae bacterium]|nr:DUF3108 domain-containing protein [Thiobacillaceae bacterium]